MLDKPKAMRNILLLIIVCGPIALFGQQIIESSQYMNNGYAYNTAVAGTKANLRVSLGARKQWFGFKNAPGIQNLTFQGRVAKSIGLGAQVFNDSWGISRRTGVNLGVNYIFSANEKMDVSLGGSLSGSQFSINAGEVVTEIPEDAAVYQGLGNQFFPNFGIAGYVASDAFYAGINVANLLEIKTDLINGASNPNYLYRTLHFVAGGDVALSEKFTIMPSIIFASTFKATSSMQVDARLEYSRLFWLGLGYRNKEALVINAGGYIKNFTVGYSFDYVLSGLNVAASGGSHELFVAFDIVKQDNKSSWFKRNRIYNNNR